MTTLFSIQPNLVISPFPTTQTLIPNRNKIPAYPILLPKRSARGSGCVTRVGFQPGPDTVESIRELFGRAESIVYTIADAAVSSSDTTLLDATSSADSVKQKSDWLSGITNSLESILKVLKGGLSAVHVPYSYGFAIILLTVLVKAATFPLTKKQVESANAMRSLQPQIKAIQKRYAGDQEKIQLETARLYKLAGINPLAGCLPTLATIPVWIGLYRALSNVADEGLLTEGFFWIPSLAGPTTVASRQSGSGISWLFPFVDGHPPLGWSDTLAYLALPMLLVVAQYVSVQIMQSSQNSDDPNLKTSQAITKFLPLMIGYFALSVPSGLSLYWLTNNLLSTAQQVWLQKLGGAKSPSVQISDDMIKDIQSKPQKYVTETISTATKAKQEKESTPEGARPGERFRKLKEQEAEKKRLREKEKSRAEEVAAKASQLAIEEHTGETKLIEKENGVEFDLVNGGNETVQSISRSHSSSNSDIVNGNLSGQHMQNDQEKDSAKPNAIPTATENKYPSE